MYSGLEELNYDLYVETVIKTRYDCSVENQVFVCTNFYAIILYMFFLLNS